MTVEDRIREMERQARQDAIAATRLPRWVVVCFWALIAFEAAVLVWSLT